MKAAMGIGLILFGGVLMLSAARNENPVHVVALALRLRTDPPGKLS